MKKSGYLKPVEWRPYFTPEMNDPPPITTGLTMVSTDLSVLILD